MAGFPGYTRAGAIRCLNEDQSIQATVTVKEGRTVIPLQGCFDFNSHREFREAIATVLASPAPAVVVDLTTVDYLDSSALGLLLMPRGRAKSIA